MKRFREPKREFKTFPVNHRIYFPFSLHTYVLANRYSVRATISNETHTLRMISYFERYEQVLCELDEEKESTMHRPCANTWRPNLEVKALKAARIAKDHVTAGSFSRKTNL